MPNYWSLNFLKSLSFKLSHLYRHRVLEPKWLWNYWKSLWRWRGVVYTHINVQRVHKSKVLFILYFQGAILKMQIFIEYWKKILKKDIENFAFWSLKCVISLWNLLNFQETFQGIRWSFCCGFSLSMIVGLINASFNQKAQNLSWRVLH